MQIITLSGIDGSGKSTQLSKLQDFLKARGAKVAYLHAVAFSLPQAARALFTRNYTSSTGLAKTKSNWLGILLRKIVLFIDLIRFRWYLKKLRCDKVDILLSDRYFYDTLVNIAYLDGTKLDTPFARFVARFIPRPDKAFYLQVTPELVMQRPRKPEQGLQYLKDKSTLFHDAANLWNFHRIDANTDIDSVSAIIRQTL